METTITIVFAALVATTAIVVGRRFVFVPWQLKRTISRVAQLSGQTSPSTRDSYRAERELKLADKRAQKRVDTELRKLEKNAKKD